MKTVLTIAAISGLLAVILGAFGAHALKGIIGPEMLETYKTGNQYHFYHTFALLMTGILMNFNQTKALRWSAYLFMTGLILFSGSLYVMAISGIKALGIITPFGGTVWIAAWILLFVHCSKLTTSK
ncbi:MAG TPA: DUF423 domain-containing protein [Prolixibacteraceae bacterium]|jgi:uncharacterized membrane protein YgdD (TMEM256/DUF423 family)